MPNWKKILQHGKDASLNDLYLTGSLEATSLTGSLDWSDIDNIPSLTGSQDLQSVTDNGNTTTKDIIINSGGQLVLDQSVAGGNGPKIVGRSGTYIEMYNASTGNMVFNSWNGITFQGGTVDFDGNGITGIDDNVGIGAGNFLGGSTHSTWLFGAFLPYNGSNGNLRLIAGCPVSERTMTLETQVIKGSPEVRLELNSQLIEVNPSNSNTNFKVSSNVGSPSLFITSSGNVGLSMETPSQRLHISGSLRIEDGGIYDKNNTNGTSGQILQSDGSEIEWADQSTITAGTASYVDWSDIDNIPTYDNYQYWNLKTNGTQRKQIQSTNDVDFVAGNNVSISYGAGGVVTINAATSSVVDTNFYLNSGSFNTGTGVLDLNVNGSTDVQVDLDGRYSLSGHTHTTSDITNLSSYTGLDARYYTETEIDSFFDGTTGIAGYNKLNWDTAYGWGDHSTQGYLTAESDTLDDVTSRGNSTSNDISVGSVTSSADIIADGNLEVKGGSVLFQGDASSDLMFELSGDPNNFDDFIQIGDVNNVGNGQLFSIDGDASEFLFQNGDVIASSSLRINGSLRTYTNNSGNSGDVLTSTGTKIDWTSPTNLTVGSALTASYTENAVSASYVQNATSASYAATASHTPPNWIFEWHDNDPVAGASYTVQFGNTISWQAGPGIKMSSTSPNSGTGAGVLIEVEDDTANGLTHELTGSLGTSLGDYDPKGFVEYAGIASTATLGAGRVNANAAGQWKIAATSLIYNKHLAMGTSDTRVLARGIIVATGSFSGVGAGDPLFLGDNGVALGSAPTGSGEYVRIIGYMVDGITTDKAYIYFDPSNDWIEIA